MSRITRYPNGNQTCKYWVETSYFAGRADISRISCICTSCNETYEYCAPHESDDLPRVAEDIIGAVNAIQEAIAGCSCLQSSTAPFIVDEPVEIDIRPGSVNTWHSHDFGRDFHIEHYRGIREAYQRSREEMGAASTVGTISLDAIEGARRQLDENDTINPNANYNIGIDLGSMSATVVTEEESTEERPGMSNDLPDDGR